MSPHDKSLEGMLATLGEARLGGAFLADAAPKPWQGVRTQVYSLSARRFAWLRVAAPLAAAAAVAIVFVGPSLLGTRTVQDMAGNSLVALGPHQPDVVADAGSIATTAQAPDCDYNSDGVVDGRDIQAFVNRLQAAGGNPDLQSEYLQRCLLGS